MILRREISSDKSIPYHVLTRAVEGRKIFAKEADCLRFIFQMYAANIGSPAPNLHRQDIIKIGRALLEGKEIPKNLIEKLIIVQHPPLVEILSFVFVVDHNHFLFLPNVENAIPKYMQKLNGGFAKYFNLKHGRKGVLFESRYKIIPIRTNFQLDAILRYINIINPLDIYQPGWRENGLKNEEDAFKFLNRYQHSSFPDLFGKRNSKILASKELIRKYLGKEIIESREEYINFIKDYLKNKLASLHSLLLEE